MEKINQSQDMFYQILDNIENNKTLSTVINGHLIIENLLNRLLNNGLTLPDRNLIDKLKFWQKVDRCVSIGLLKSKSRPAYKMLNTIRNQFAHELDKKITKKEVIDFYNKLTEEQQSTIQNIHTILDEFKIEVALSDIIFALFFEIDWELRKITLK